MDRLLKGLKALADETRLRMTHILLTQDLCGRALARQLGISEAAVSQHMKILREAGVVEGEKRGYWVHYSVKKEVLEQLVSELDGMACRSAVPAGGCHGLRARKNGFSSKEVKNMCQCCCERPEKLKGKPDDCTAEQIKACHGDDKGHPCLPKKEDE
jgi:DNA-binding transcriptional ArsR family regulator